MKRILLIAVGAFLLFFLVLTFLNCGQEANAIPDRERVKRHKITDTDFHSRARQQTDSVINGVAVDCKRVDATFTFENYLANRLFSWTLIGRWCYDGERVVSHRWSKDFHIGNYWWSNWRFEGMPEDPNDGGGDGRRYVFRRIRGQFAANVLWFERNVTPYVQCTLRGDGTHECGKGD